MKKGPRGSSYDVADCLTVHRITEEDGPLVRFCSIFSQLLQLFPRTEFQKAVVATGAARATKGFGCWDQFVAMLFCHLGACLFPAGRRPRSVSVAPAAER